MAGNSQRGLDALRIIQKLRLWGGAGVQEVPKRHATNSLDGHYCRGLGNGRTARTGCGVGSGSRDRTGTALVYSTGSIKGAGTQMLRHHIRCLSVCLLFHGIAASLCVQLLLLALVLVVLVGAVGGVVLGQRCCQRCSRWLVGTRILRGHGSIAICGQEKGGMQGAGALMSAGGAGSHRAGGCLPTVPVSACMHAAVSGQACAAAGTHLPSGDEDAGAALPRGWAAGPSGALPCRPAAAGGRPPWGRWREGCSCGGCRC